MPASLTGKKIAKQKWKETCAILAEMRVITIADQVLIERLCLTYAHYLEALADIRKNGLVMDMITQAGVKRVRNPAAQEFHACESDLHKQTSELGLTPSSRSRLKAVEQIDEEDPFDELLARMNRG